jgi:hypothetical protein
LDALAQAFFDSIEVEPESNAPPAASDAPTAEEIRAQVDLLETFARKTRLLTPPAPFRYENLLAARDVLLRSQRQVSPAPGEEQLKRLYFELRNRAQDELKELAATAYAGRGRQRNEEGKEALIKIREFLGRYPDPRLTRQDEGYPEWAWYVEDAMQKPPYNAM